ncbi:hypothetical protein R1sor_003178 [Riccia sorocarpa]|uniref:AB hydrolase-1 domain-containing protein n=1 Tax=Riccia sorocarpa TaxID=122646 RepID=A0ABD3H310_9MARC
MARLRFTALVFFTLVVTAKSLDYEEEKPEVVLVHGSCLGAWNWFKVQAALEDKGYKVTALDLLGMGRDRTPVDQITSVAMFAKPLTDYLASVPNKVILVGHSLGGVSISFAMELLPQKVSKAVFVTACMPRNNQSALDTFPPDLFPGLVSSGAVIINFGNGPNSLPTSFSVSSSIAEIINNESPKELVDLELSLLGSNPYAPLVEPLTLTKEKYGSVRRFYIVVGKDHLFFPDTYQKPLIEANGPVEQVFDVKGGDHCVFFSKPKELTDLLIRITETN